MAEPTSQGAAQIPRTRKQWQTILDIVASVVMIAAGVLIIRSYLTSKAPTSRELTVPKEAISLDGAAVRGALSAPVGILEFSDFQCPFCLRFAKETMPTIDQTYVKPGKVLLAFRHLPLADIHPLATKAAEAASCAGRQGRFWEAHDYFYGDPERLRTANVVLASSVLGLDQPNFEACLSGQSAAQVKWDVAEAGRLGIKGTPAFLIGRMQADGRLKTVKILSGARGFEDFQSAIEAVLASVSAGTAPGR